MKIKYYLRGFGTGLLFVALIFLVLQKPQELTEDELIRQAQGLGMLTEKEADEKRLSAIQENELKWQERLDEKRKETDELMKKLAKAEADLEQIAEAEAGDNAEADGEPAGEDNAVAENPDETPAEETPADTEVPEEESTDGESSETETPDGESDGDETDEPVMISFTITRGMTSEKVSKLLEKAGLVEDADDFNRYLVSVGKQSSIDVGNYRIEKGTDYAGIAAYIAK